MSDQNRPAYDIEKVRADFPILAREVHGKPLIYFDSAASAQRPLAVINAIDTFYRSHNANIHRGVHALSQEATEAYEAARETMARFINAPSAREIVFTRGTTESVNLVAQSFIRPQVKPGDEILVTHLEHHSNIVPWQLVCEQTGAELKVVPLTETGELDQEGFARLLNSRVKLFAVGHVSNALGTINPVKAMVKAAREFGIPVLIDGAQAAPHLAIDVQDIDCDFYCVSGHKMYGPTGIGILWGRRELLDAMPPYQGGGEMIQYVSFEETIYNEVPGKFEAGTPNIAGAIGMGAAADYLLSVGLEAIAEWEHQLLLHATEKLESVDGLRIIGTSPNKASVISFTLEGIHPHDLGTIIDHEGIAIRTGHHCAMPVMQYFNVPATSRVSLGMYNTISEIDQLLPAIKRARAMLA